MSELPIETKSIENSRVLELRDSVGIERLGIMSSQVWHDDPQGLLFTLSRYKFVSRILKDFKNVLEIGCGDGFYSRLVQQQVKLLTITDHDPIFINDIKNRNPENWNLNAKVLNPLLSKIHGEFDGIYFLDVLEHINRKEEEIFISNIINSLTPQGTLIVGMPSLESQLYASEISKEGHINCKTGRELKSFMEKFFSNVTIFSMNDEIVHTGFWPMSHYLFAICNILI